MPPVISPYKPRTRESRGAVPPLSLSRDAVRTRSEQTRIESRDAGDYRDTLEYRAAFGAYLRRGLDGLTGFQRTALLEDVEHRDQSTAGSAGGFAVPAAYMDDLVLSMRYASAVFATSRHWDSRTPEGKPTGAAASFPASTDVANAAAQGAENTAPTQADPVFTQVAFGSTLGYQVSQRASIQLDVDASPALEVSLSRIIGERIGRGFDRDSVSTSTGASGVPQGLLSASGFATFQLPSGNTSSVSFASLVDAVFSSVDMAYMRAPGACIIVAPATLAAFYKLTGTDNLSIVQTAWADESGARVPTLLGIPVFVSRQMLALGANNVFAFVGNLQYGYVTRIVGSPEVIRLEERFADSLQVGFIGLYRLDGRIADKSAGVLLQNSAT